MMTNLFSIFDPSNYMLKMSWILPILVIMSPLLVKNSKFNSMLMNVLNLIFIEIKTMSMSNLTAAFLMPLFASILMLNLMSMIPTLFTMNSQISVVLPMGLCFWLSIILFFLTKKMNSFLTHLVPEGAPAMLTPALVLIELTSNLIRPITLSVRLIANMTAGHLLMHLLSSLVCYIYPMSPLLIPVSMILTSLELMVAFIQAYIFCALLSLYSSEIH